MKSAKDKRAKRQTRIRKKVMGTAERPRLSIFKSSKHIYAQVIDDVNGKTLAAASTVGKGAVAKNANIEGAKKVGSAIAERAKSNNITTVVFDRGGFKYHGRVKALADAAREKGLKF